MKTIMIILAVYVALDIIASIWLYIALRVKGWRLWTMALALRSAVKYGTTAPYYLNDEDDYDEDDYDDTEYG